MASSLTCIRYAQVQRGMGRAMFVMAVGVCWREHLKGMEESSGPFFGMNDG